MRLLNARTLRLEEFVANIPPYTILSHYWGADEVTFEDVYVLMDLNKAIERKTGWQKIRQCCRQTLHEGFHYVWVDTCCINKSSSAELSEAINSMFRWYRDATVCFAYLADVPSLYNEASFLRSRWFTRGWTLQELIAPREVIFFDASWTSSISRRLVAGKIHDSIGIDAAVLLGSHPLRSHSVAQRLSWAAQRETTRLEDQAYSLLGLFGVHMPLMYGEGGNAFLRLQEEILRVEQDLSILAWSIPEHGNVIVTEGTSFPLSPTPSFFKRCANTVSALSSEQQLSEQPDIVITAHSIRLTTKVMKAATHNSPDNKIVAVLNCREAKDVTRLIAMEISPISHSPDVMSMHSSEILKVRDRNRMFYAHDRIVMVDAFEFATNSVTRTILIQRTHPWSAPFDFYKRFAYSHLWVRFDDPTLSKKWMIQKVFPEEVWMPQHRTLDIHAAFEGKRKTMLSSRGVQFGDLGGVINAAIVMTDGSIDQVVIFLRMQSNAPLDDNIRFRLGHFHPNSYDPEHQSFEDLPDSAARSIQLHDGTSFTVRREKDLITDKVIAHLAISIDAYVDPLLPQ